MRPEISVVMPHYNQSHLISNAIMSIVNQSMDDWELIIVDDGSNLEHIKKLNSLVLNFNERCNDKIKIFFQPHEGLVSARNRGNKESHAQYIAVQDADDLSMPDRLEKCLTAIADTDVVVHGAYINMWDKKMNCITRKFLPPGIPNKVEILKGQNLTGWPIFRKKVWKEKPYRKETQYMYDWSMHLDWLLSGYVYRTIDEGLYEYVRQESSASIRFEREGLRAESHQKIKEVMLSEYGKTVI